MEVCAKTILIMRMTPPLQSQFVTSHGIAHQLWVELQRLFGHQSEVKLAKLEEDLDHLTIFDFTSWGLSVAQMTN